mmetsp:Transcript_4099/g.6953  ORF Transcript_4099/g.6953 Transcript_4099/m.6953 type:complete len:395 (+) Transcript_4099:141-1325(+)
MAEWSPKAVHVSLLVVVICAIAGCLASMRGLNAGFAPQQDSTASSILAAQAGLPLTWLKHSPDLSIEAIIAPRPALFGRTGPTLQGESATPMEEPVAADLDIGVDDTKGEEEEEVAQADEEDDEDDEDDNEENAGQAQANHAAELGGQELPKGYKPISFTSNFFKLLRGPRFPVNLSRCALVGSSAILLDRGRGPEIDAYSAVIRVNRIPREASYADMGVRTDVIFGNCRAYDDLSRGVLPTLAGHKVNCKQVSCPKVFVLKYCGKVPRSTLNKCARMGITPAAMGKTVFSAANWAKGQRRSAPMTGVYAFFTFAPLCDSLTVFGFGGGTQASIDGVHYHRPGLHNTDADNQLLDRLLDPAWTEPSHWRRNTTAFNWLKRWVPVLRTKTRIIRD